MEKKLVVVRLDRDLVKRIDHYAVEWGEFRGPTIERMLTIVVGQIGDSLHV